MPYSVRTPVYEGPFDLLLHLILRSEVELFELSLSTIVDEYIVEIERMDTLDLDVATEFLLIAATLVELKARRLLPDLNDGELDEELLRFEARDLLLARLLECKTFKDAADALSGLIGRADRSVPRIAGPEEPFRSLVPDPLDRVTMAQLAAAARRALTPKAVPTVDTDHVAPVRASVADAIAIVIDRLPVGQAVPFRVLAAGAGERVEAVVRFLAVLELYKQGSVELEQLQTFGTLMVTRLAEGVALDVESIADWDLDVENVAALEVDDDEEDEDADDFADIKANYTDADFDDTDLDQTDLETAEESV